MFWCGSETGCCWFKNSCVHTGVGWLRRSMESRGNEIWSHHLRLSRAKCYLGLFIVLCLFVVVTIWAVRREILMKCAFTSRLHSLCYYFLTTQWNLPAACHNRRNHKSIISAVCSFLRLKALLLYSILPSLPSPNIILFQQHTPFNRSHQKQLCGCR